MADDKDTPAVEESRELSDAELDKVVGGGTNHTGGRFMLDIAGHNVGFAQSPPPPPTPTKTKS
ncbi:MAG: hypothetical protein AB7I01_07575 [Gammaproteobacteria bacterium]